MPLQYTIEFEPNNRLILPWIIVDTESYEGELGYYYKKDDAEKAARLFNEHSDLLALRTKVRVISGLLDDEANHLMNVSSGVPHPKASATIISHVGFSLKRIRILSNQLDDAIKTDGGE
jgi:hypothetical protein